MATPSLAARTASALTIIGFSKLRVKVGRHKEWRKSPIPAPGPVESDS
jgi:hypothetical protein